MPPPERVRDNYVTHSDGSPEGDRPKNVGLAEPPQQKQHQLGRNLALRQLTLSGEIYLLSIGNCENAVLIILKVDH